METSYLTSTRSLLAAERIVHHKRTRTQLVQDPAAYELGSRHLQRGGVMVQFVEFLVGEANGQDFAALSAWSARRVRERRVPSIFRLVTVVP